MRDFIEIFFIEAKGNLKNDLQEEFEKEGCLIFGVDKYSLPIHLQCGNGSILVLNIDIATMLVEIFQKSFNASRYSANG